MQRNFIVESLDPEFQMKVGWIGNKESNQFGEPVTGCTKWIPFCKHFHFRITGLVGREGVHSDEPAAAIQPGPAGVDRAESGGADTAKLCHASS
jgi:hypothetical protein